MQFSTSYAFKHELIEDWGGKEATYTLVPPLRGGGYGDEDELAIDEIEDTVLENAYDFATGLAFYDCSEGQKQQVRLRTKLGTHEMKLFVPLNVMAQVIYDEVVELTELSLGQFKLTGQNTSIEWTPDMLVSSLSKDDWTAYIDLKLMGGGKPKTIRTVVKDKSKGVSASDMVVFQNILTQSQQLQNLKVEDIKATFTNLPLPILKEMKYYLEHDKGTATIKMAGIIGKIPAIAQMEDAMSKIATTSQMAREICTKFFQMNCATPEGDVRLPMLKSFIDGRIAIQEEASGSSGAVVHPMPVAKATSPVAPSGNGEDINMG